ncbi:hypothetical protein C8T65DRAFT_728852 [Cerioporus squamosus]|nr:hypothetical protein C8T65DRAFT_728852 [Cerioporus squamosus]
MDAVKFSLDIFHMLMSSSDRCEVSHLMRTCHVLNHEGASYILAEDPVLETGVHARSFVHFAAARGDPVEIAHRLERLRGLEIDLRGDSEARIVAPLLTTLLVDRARFMKNLVRIYILDRAHALVEAAPELPAAIAELTTLESLTLGGIDRRGLEGLNGLKSRLSRAGISVELELADDVEGYDIASLLQGSTMTLCSVSLSAVFDPMLLPSPPSFAHVRHLSLEYARSLVTPNLVAAFPNVEKLEGSWLVLTTLDQVEDEILDHHRAQNIVGQQEHGTWRHLRSFRGSLPMLYVLGLTCHVPFVSVSLDENEGFDLRWARAIVADTRPTHLTFDIDFPTYFAEQDSFSEDLIALFSHRAFQNVKVLKIRFLLMPGDSDLEMESFLDTFFQAIALCSADAVALTIHAGSLRSPWSRRPHSPGAAEVYMRTFDARALAHRLKEMAPSLRTVIISHNPGSSKGATVRLGPKIPAGLDAELDCTHMKSAGFMNQPVLVEDVVYIIMSFADRPTISRMMQTCRTLSRGGVPYILHDDVKLYLSSLKASFFRFIFADPPRRLQSLCGLSVSPHEFGQASEEIPDDVPELLKGFFVLLAMGGENFTRLRLHDAEVILQLHPDLPDAIASLTRLEELNIDSAGSLSCKLLANIRSSLYVVKVSLLDEDDDPALTLQDKTPTTLLRGSRTTLEYLSISDVHTIPDGPRYPNLTVLDIINTWTFITHHFVHAFPSLTKLYVSESFVSGARNVEELTTLREANLFKQRRHGAWNALREYWGPLGILYVLGLTCRITEMHLDDMDGHVFDPRLLRAVLSDARPSRLTVMLEDGLHFMAPGIVQIFRDRCAKEVDYLQLELEIKARDIEAHRVSALMLSFLQDALCSIVDESSVVTTFDLLLQWSFPDLGIRGCDDPAWSTVLQEIDVAAYAEKMLAKNKNLKRLKLAISNGRRDGAASSSSSSSSFSYATSSGERSQLLFYMVANNAPPSAGGAYTQADLAKLTVPQLKALCKERKIPGYSKLGKQALLQKLVENGLCSASEGASGPGTPSVISAGTVPPEVATHTPSAAATRGSISAAATRPDTPSSFIASSNTTGSTNDGVIVPQPPAAPPSKPKAQKKPRKLKASQPPGPSTIPQVSSAVSRQPSAALAAVSSLPAAVGSSSPHTDAPGLPPTLSSSTITTCQVQTPTSTRNVSQTPSLTRKVPPLRASATGNKRDRPSIETMPPPPLKKQRVLSSSSTPNVERSLMPATLAVSKPTAPVATTTRVPVQPIVLVVPAPTSAKRFKPLLVNKAKVSASASSTPTSIPALPFEPVRVLAVKEHALYRLQDFEASVPALRPITLPPSLAQRKRVHRWAVILSALSNKERAACALVSRAFRYAVYLSASCILTGKYHGHRLQDDVLRKHSQAMTNMWPYLRARELEVVERRRAYESTFFARFFQKCRLANPVSSRLWASPDSPRQLLVAVRFALTRAWFELSEVVAGEIWLITVEYAAPTARPRPPEVLYVLEATCEVVGRQSPTRSGPKRRACRSQCAPTGLHTSSGGKRRRKGRRHLIASPPEVGMCGRLPPGISKLWLKKVAGEGAGGDGKRMVAERYVLACVVGNGISGQWMTANEMAQEFAGLPERVAPPPGRQKSTALNLYLPEHHHVESVHFTSAGGKDLHVGLAVVQTPHREYFILRDNGMQVGCEEEGVAPVWQEVLGCDAKGLST